MIRRSVLPVAAALLFSTLASSNVQAQGPKPAKAPELTKAPVIESDAVRLLRRMVAAERRVPYIAREATLRADAAGTEHIVKSNPRQGLRREPADGKGRVMLDDNHNLYSFRPDKPEWIDVDQSRLPKQLAKRIDELVKRLGRGILSAQVVGQDTVAGRACDIVEVRATRVPDAPTRRFWIDRENGLRLRTEEKDAQGKVLSGSYYTQLDLKPKFAAKDFSPPVGGERKRDDRERLRFKSVAEARKAHFTVLEPGYLPPDYSLRQVEAAANGGHVTLRYANGLNTLSLTVLRDGVPSRVLPFLRSDGTVFVPFPQGKHGLFAKGDNGAAYLLIGDLPESELQKIAASVK